VSAAHQAVTANQVARVENFLRKLSERGSTALRNDLKPILLQMDDFAGHTPIEIWQMFEERGNEKQRIYLPLILMEMR